MDCAQIQALLFDYVDDALPPKEQAEIESHVAGCEGCRLELASLRAYLQAVRTMQPVEAPPGFAARLNQRLDALPTWSQRLRSALLFPLAGMPLRAAGLVASVVVVILLYHGMTPKDRESEIPGFMTESIDEAKSKESDGSFGPARTATPTPPLSSTPPPVAVPASPPAASPHEPAPGPESAASVTTPGPSRDESPGRRVLASPGPRADSVQEDLQREHLGSPPRRRGEAGISGAPLPSTASPSQSASRPAIDIELVVISARQKAAAPPQRERAEEAARPHSHTKSKGADRGVPPNELREPLDALRSVLTAHSATVVSEERAEQGVRIGSVTARIPAQHYARLIRSLASLGALKGLPGQDTPPPGRDPIVVRIVLEIESP